MPASHFSLLSFSLLDVPVLLLPPCLLSLLMVHRVGLALLLTLFTIVYDTKKGGLLNASSKVVAGDADDCGYGGGGGVDGLSDVICVPTYFSQSGNCETRRQQILSHLSNTACRYLPPSTTLTALRSTDAPLKDGKSTRLSVASSHHSEDHMSAGDAFARRATRCRRFLCFLICLAARLQRRLRAAVCSRLHLVCVV
jgi:hypothetical protein